LKRDVADVYGIYIYILLYHKIKNYGAWEKKHLNHNNKVRQISMKVLWQTHQDVEVSGRSVAEPLPHPASAFSKTPTDEQLSYCVL
jgi:hypothetical protein